MGTWGARIYESDTALDVRDEFISQLSRKQKVADIEMYIHQEYDFNDVPENNDEVLLALACVELETGTLTDTTKQAALEVIDSNRVYDYWLKESSKEDAGLRKRELTLVKKYLTNYNDSPVKRKSWVALQRKDEDSDDIKDAKLDDISWHSGTVIDHESDHDYSARLGGHIIAFIRWLIAREYFGQQQNAKSYLKNHDIVTFFDNQMDGKLFVSNVIADERAFATAYYTTKRVPSVFTDYVEIVGDGYDHAPSAKELKALFERFDERHAAFEANPKKFQQSVRGAWARMLIFGTIAVICIALYYVLVTYVIFHPSK